MHEPLRTDAKHTLIAVGRDSSMQNLIELKVRHAQTM